MKEFILTQPYNSIEEMINSGEVAVYKDELKQSNIQKYAIVSRLGNKYDVYGTKIDGFAMNPFIENKKEQKTEGFGMKYYEIEMLIEKEIEKAVAEVNAKYEQELANLKETHAQELANAKYEVKAELLAKLNS